MPIQATMVNNRVGYEFEGRDQPFHRLVGPKDLERIVKAVTEGLPGSNVRLADMRMNEAYYRMKGADHVPRRADETVSDYAKRPKQCLYVLREAVDDLCDGLYSPGPTRKVSRGDGAESIDEASAEYVERVLLGLYKTAHVDVVMAEANRKAVLNDACAVQVAFTEDPRRPLKLYTYGGDEFEVFCPPDDPTTPWAVVTISVESAEKNKKRRVLTLHTPTEIVRYATKPVAEDATFDGEKAAPDGEPERHGLGMLPFVFIHNRRPIDTFWGNGIGEPLRRTNQEVDRILSDWAECQQKFLVPDVFTRNVSPSWRYNKRPGEPQDLTPPPEARMGDMAVVPEFFYVQPTMDWGMVKEHVAWLIDAARANLKIPPPMVGRDGSRATSGIQVLAEQIPYWRYLESRREYLDMVESELARVVTAAHGTYFDDGPLRAFADDWPGLTLTWSPPSLPLPTRERNEADEFELKHFLASPQQIMARRLGITKAEAEEKAAEIATDAAAWNAMFATVGPVATAETPAPEQAAPEPTADPDPEPDPEPEDES